ncbi:hypothetical protein FM120_01055 [Sphingobacterium faecium PCAi_F2.5]|nr:hypothetical protein FM120_01055 [Sphingobacterium faecium PCAi_F2.5]
MKFYNTNGIPTDKPINDQFYISELANGELILSSGDQSYEIEKICIQLRDHLAVKLFGDRQTYHSYFTTPIFPFASLAGIDAEIKISKEDFEKLVSGVEDKERLSRLLYYFDVENLIGTLQNAVLETKYILGSFYKTLNNNNFLLHDDLTVVNDGIQYASGYIVTNITSIVNHLFINLYSQMDFTTKIIYEFENLHTNFSKYPKLKSKDTLYGDSKKTTFKEKQGSIYELSETIRTIMYLRNEIVHNASIDSIPKVYQNLENKKIVEKYILLPDFSNGIIKTYKNRKRFFDNDTKLNDILPALIDEFWDRLKFTLSEIK